MRKKIMCLLGVTIVVSITCAKAASAVALSGQNLTITPIAEKSFYMYDYRPRGVYHVAADVRNNTDVAHYYRADLVDAFTSENGLSPMAISHVTMAYDKWRQIQRIKLLKYRPKRQNVWFLH